MSGAYKCVKALFVALNVLFMLLGFAVAGVGVYIEISRGDFMLLMPDYDVASAGALLIGAGIVVLFVAACGFVGALMANQCILGFYLFCVLIILGLEIAAGVLGFIFKGDVEEKLQEQLQKSLKNAATDEATKAVWEEVQQRFKCCGVHNYSEWYGVHSQQNLQDIPDSCCRGTGCYGQTKTGRKGCYDDLFDWFSQNYVILGIVGIVVGVIQIFMIIAASVLICYIRRERKYVA